MHGAREDSRIHFPGHAGWPPPRPLRAHPIRHRFHLVDASPYVFRAYYSIPDTLTSPDGKPVNAVHGFVDFLLRYIREHAPTHLALAFDESLSSSFRNDFYPPYKAQRELPPEELKAQFRWCQQAGRALGAAVFSDARYEADDIVATLCRRLVRRGHDIVVVSNDKDLTQLVERRVVFRDAAKGLDFDVAGVQRQWGILPDQVPDFLGLAGDAVDNIPGVRGVGNKTAAALLAVYADLDAIYADLPGVAALPLRGAAGVAARLAEHRELAYLSRRLATVAVDAPVRADPRVLRLKPAMPAAVETLARELGLQRLAERMLAPRL